MLHGPEVVSHKRRPGGVPSGQLELDFTVLLVRRVQAFVDLKFDCADFMIARALRKV